MELVEGGSLESLVSTRGRMSDSDTALLMRVILEAVGYLHEQKVIHRDLKTANILLQDPEDLKSVKIIDFGFGERNLMTKASFDEHVGTLVYMAPEVAF